MQWAHIITAVRNNRLNNRLTRSNLEPGANTGLVSALSFSIRRRHRQPARHALAHNRLSVPSDQAG